MSRIRPFGKNVLIRIGEPTKQTLDGVLLPESYSTWTDTATGVVVDVGSGVGAPFIEPGMHVLVRYDKRIATSPPSCKGDASSLFLFDKDDVLAEVTE